MRKPIEIFRPENEVPVSLLRACAHTIIDWSIETAARVRRQFRNHDRPTKSVLIVVPSSPGSVGDAAMLAGLTQSLRSCGVRKIGLISQGELRWCSDVRADFQIDGSGALKWFGRSEMLKIALRLWGADTLYVVGADTIDGTYNPSNAKNKIRVMNLSCQFGCRVVLTGCSISENPDSGVMNLMGALPSEVDLNARDPVSQSRLENALKRRVGLTADCAFLPIEGQDREKEIEIFEWISRCRREGRSIVAINANALQLGKAPDLMGVLQHCAERLSEFREIGVILIPHDNRGDVSDICISEELNEKLGLVLDEVVLISEPLTPSRISGIISSVDLVITGRMHLAILSLARSVVPLCITYQGKFEGLYQLFNLPEAELLVTPENAIKDPDGFAQKAKMALKESASYKSAIAERLPAVRSLAKKNLALFGQHDDARHWNGVGASSDAIKYEKHKK